MTTWQKNPGGSPHGKTAVLHQPTYPTLFYDLFVRQTRRLKTNIGIPNDKYSDYHLTGDPACHHYIGLSHIPIDT